MASSDGATLVARGLSAAYGDRQLFSGLDLVVGPGEVIGLVGANGAGKSSLLRLLVTLAAGDGDLDGISPERPAAEPGGAGAGPGITGSGQLTITPPGATIGYLPQEPDRRPGETVAQFI
ncbi:MAG: ATP-binding cassette domain-containing protein, partial [Actinomycetota bacterium]|nr:ATP-binding cassette domain-containing protein [Actinomycetota bacterium]